MNWLRSLLALLLTLALLVGVALFSLLLLPFVLGLFALGFGAFWWHTRHLRRVLREQAAQAAAQRSDDTSGTVVEGEATVVDISALETRTIGQNTGGDINHDPTQGARGRN